MAGVKQFDREEVLNHALEVFWQRGYAATSIQDLVEATRISRGSLYNAFGDKDSLFLEVLDRYVDREVSTLMTALNDLEPRRAIAKMFAKIIERMSNSSYPRGCLITNTCLECPSSSDKLNRKLVEQLGNMETAIYQVLLRAQAQGSLASGQDVRALARFFVGVAQGIAVMHKTCADPSVLRDIAEVALNIWEVPVLTGKDKPLSPEVINTQRHTAI